MTVALDIKSMYLHCTEAVLDESLDLIILGLFQNLIQFSAVLWKRYWAISEEVQNKVKVSATPIKNDPTCAKGKWFLWCSLIFGPLQFVL